MIARLSEEEIKAAADRAEARAQGKTPEEEFVATTLDLDAEIKKLAALPIGVYESKRVEEAKLVQAEHDKATKGKKDFLPHWQVEPWSEPVDGAALLEDLRKQFTRYAVLPQHVDVVAAVWTLLSWNFDCFDITPYLAITSPTRRCGKTLLMTLLYWLCCRAKKNDSMSQAAIYRSVEVEKPTLILDEVYWVLDRGDDRHGIINGGFERNGYVEICEGEGANITVRRWSTFCPKAFGLIGKLTPTLMDRSIEIRMQRKLGEKVERLRRRDNDDHKQLRQRCRRWAEDNQDALPTVTPKLPAELNDREFDVWELMFAVAERAGGDWLRLTTEAAIGLSGSEGAAEESGVDLLADIKKVFDQCRRGTAVGNL